MPLTKNVIKKIADDTGVKPDDITEVSLLAFLREKRRRVMAEMHEVLKRYNVMRVEELEGKIKIGEIPEHPAWEDLIFLENLESTLECLKTDIETIRRTT